MTTEPLRVVKALVQEPRRTAPMLLGLSQSLSNLSPRGMGVSIYMPYHRNQGAELRYHVRVQAKGRPPFYAWTNLEPGAPMEQRRELVMKLLLLME